MDSPDGESAGREALTVALLPWGDLIEDFLDGIQVSLESFCTEMSGGWLFGYVDALRSAGIRTVVFCTTGRLEVTTQYTNQPTGAVFCVLPAGRGYLRLRRYVSGPDRRAALDAPEAPRGGRTLSVARMAAPYFATPVPQLIRELRRERCGAILCQEYEYARFDICVGVGKLLRMPVFATFQGGDRPLSRLEGLVRPHTMRASSGLIIAARTEADRVRARYGVPDEKIARIVNPLDARAWQPDDRAAARAALGIAAEAKVVVWHGRVDMRRKGLDVLLDAWEDVAGKQQGDHQKDLLLLLVGTGDDAEELRRRLATSSVQSVRWVDEYVLDRALMRRFLSAADVYVLPSRHEGFPVAPIEAMACGLPVVATDVPGMRDIIGDGAPEAGIIVPHSDSAALGRALAALLADGSRARAMGAEASRRVQERFSTAAVGQQLRRFLTQTSGQFE